MPHGSGSGRSGGSTGVIDEIKGRVPEVYIALQPGLQASQAIIDKVNKAIETMIGKIARPRRILIVPDMPKTRSGKLMRRVLAALSNNIEHRRYHNPGQS